MARSLFVSKLSLALAGATLALAANAQSTAPQSSDMIPETGRPPAAQAWSHAELMRLYSWVIVNDSGRECNRVLNVMEKSDGSVVATCSAYPKHPQSGSLRAKALRYRVDQIPLKANFSERWFNVTPVRASNVPDEPSAKVRRPR